MTLELEALERVVSEVNTYKLHGLGEDSWLGIQDILKDVNILKNALTELEELRKGVNK